MRHKPTKPKYTYYWHIHHDTLCEGTYNIKERIAYIKKHKPKKEIPTRLQLMTPVLHPEKLPKEFRKAADACDKAYAAFIKAHDASAKASIASTKAYAAYDKAYAAFIKAFNAYAQALDAYAETLHMPQLEELHREEHPHCPWNGKTIFPK